MNASEKQTLRDELDALHRVIAELQGKYNTLVLEMNNKIWERVYSAFNETKKDQWRSEYNLNEDIEELREHIFELQKGLQK